MKKSTDRASKEGIDRREMVKLTTAAIITPVDLAKGLQTRKGSRRGRRFFTATEFRTVDELSEMIIPTDQHSPGARAAKVADYIDRTLSETPHEDQKREWREGLSRIESLSKEMHGKSFMQSSPAERLSLLDRIAQNEAKPEKPEEKFFVELKARVAHAYYTSKIGLRQELEYKGNTYLREFAGETIDN